MFFDLNMLKAINHSAIREIDGSIIFHKPLSISVTKSDVDGVVEGSVKLHN